MFSKYVLFQKGHLNKRVGVWTPWTTPGSATVYRLLSGVWGPAEIEFGAF